MATLAKYVQHRHPLVEQAFQTDRRDLFMEHVGKVVNLSKDEQIRIPGVMELYRERIERDPKGLFKPYPFVMEPNAERAEADPDESGGRFSEASDRRNRHLDRGRLLEAQRPGIRARPGFRIWRHAKTDRRSHPVGAAADGK